MTDISGGGRMRIGSLFTGYGGLDIAACQHFDAETVWTSDIDPGARKIIAHRYPDIPNLGDITTIDWATVPPVDILTGGFPCQDVSAAGKQAGMRPDTRSGLWTQMAYAIDQLRPRYVVAENVRGLLSASADSSVVWPRPLDQPQNLENALARLPGAHTSQRYDDGNQS